jgi:hypothetical protein
VANNYPLIYTDDEIDSYISRIAENLKRPPNERDEHWFIGLREDFWNDRRLLDLSDDTILDQLNGNPIELPYNFWIMRNVREALQPLAEQS